MTSSKLVILSRSEIPEDNLEALEKIRMLEDHAKYGRQEEEEIEYRVPPKFIIPLQGKNDLWEGQIAHLETRVEPHRDPNLKINW